MVGVRIEDTGRHHESKNAYTISFVVLLQQLHNALRFYLFLVSGCVGLWRTHTHTHTKQEQLHMFCSFAKSTNHIQL